MDYNHIHPDFRHVMGMNDVERIAFMDYPRWIGYRSAKNVIDTLQGLMAKPQQNRMPNLLLIGEPNNGKTTIIQRFYDLCGQGSVNEDAEPVKPIVVAEAPPHADEKSLYMSILDRFFAPYRPTDSAANLRGQVIRALRYCHTRILIIDEFHSMLTGSALKQREVMNAIKLLCNELKIPIVGVGTRVAVQVLHTDPQHASRFDVLELPVWSLNQDFQRLLASFEKVLPLKHASRLHQPELALPLHAICDGNFGNLHRLLVECSATAIKSGQESIDKKTIEAHAWLRPTRGGIRERVA